MYVCMYVCMNVMYVHVCQFSHTSRARWFLGWGIQQLIVKWSESSIYSVEGYHAATSQCVLANNGCAGTTTLVPNKIVGSSELDNDQQTCGETCTDHVQACAVCSRSMKMMLVFTHLIKLIKLFIKKSNEPPLVLRTRCHEACHAGFLCGAGTSEALGQQWCRLLSQLYHRE